MPQSSFHAWWQGLPNVPIVSCAAKLNIGEIPTDDQLYFWAMQMTICDSRGVGRGGMHTGLQHNPRFTQTGSRAVNWGGYVEGTNTVLRGTDPSLPFFAGDPNTAGFAWEPNRNYWLRVYRDAHGWVADITDLVTRHTTMIRRVFCDGDRLTNILVWAEIFAPCDHTPTSAKWSDFTVQTSDGSLYHPTFVRLTFPGPCGNTNIAVDGNGVVLQSSVVRTARDGDVLGVPIG